LQPILELLQPGISRLLDYAMIEKERLMITVEQYRAKAAEYAGLAKKSNGSNNLRELKKLEQTFTQLADNQQWINDNYDKTLHAFDYWNAVQLKGELLAGG
jgi:hypothetical protein